MIVCLSILMTYWILNLSYEYVTVFTLQSSEFNQADYKCSMWNDISCLLKSLELLFMSGFQDFFSKKIVLSIEYSSKFCLSFEKCI